METSCKSLVQEKREMLQEMEVTSSLPAVRQSYPIESLNILELPDSILLQIFAGLPFSSVGAVAKVCKHWSEVALDDLLWRRQFLRYYKLPGITKMPSSATSWRQEFKRLYYHTPVILSEERREHKDEVLHVSFSNNGQMFATCSKDGYFKVWSCSHPSELIFSMDMKNSFTWKFTQFSQFNASDTNILVSGVYIGNNSTSGEIAVFCLPEFKLQCRVTNKPYDVFGAWFDDDHLLSGTLYWTGVMNSVSAIWLSKASQEVEAEMESVSMMLYRFENVNSSSIRLLNVAEVPSDDDDVDEYGLQIVPKVEAQNPGSSSASSNQKRPDHQMDTSWPSVATGSIRDSALHFRSAPYSQSRRKTSSNFLDKLLRKSIAEDEFDLSNEDKTDEEDDGKSESYGNGKLETDWFEDSGGGSKTCEGLLNSEQPTKSGTCCTSGPDRDLKYSQLDVLMETNSQSESIKDNPGSEEDCLVQNHYPMVDGSNNLPTSEMNVNNNSPIFKPDDSRLSSQNVPDNADLAGSDSGASFYSDSDEELHSSVGTQTLPLPRPAPSPCCRGSMESVSPSLCKEKLLIYTWGSETYIPHKIGIKRIKYSDICKGEVTARSQAVLLPDVMANLANNADGRRDRPDHTIEMHGHIVGLSLSPDHRHLFVNCRPWPKDYIISDPQESPPLAQEVEISSIDLKTFEFVGPVLRSHRAFTHSDECFFLNLDVCHQYVVSGAEDFRGYLWDRHYGRLLYQFPHNNVVNCAAVCPTDPELMVTVSDDHTFKVWTSRHRARFLKNR